jgi:PPOX class probable F420-dependent enzyme
MPAAPLPETVLEFVRRPFPAVVASLRPDGSPHTVATWYDWDRGEVLLNMDVSRRRLGFMRNDPRVALTIVDPESFDHISLYGVITRIEADGDLAGIDRLARRYTGRAFRNRTSPRFNAWLRVETWHGWRGAGPWPEETTAR